MSRDRPLTVYLADLTYTTLSLATEAFPLNIGFVAAFCKARFGSAVDLRLFKYIDDLDETLRQRPPDVLGLSNYPWNHHVGIEFFRMARALSSSTLCVMGGPNIPLDDGLRSDYLRQRPEIDFYAYLEGEEPFSNLIARVLDVGPDRDRLRREAVPGMIQRAADGELLKGDFIPRRKHLDDIPSPYLTGILDQFFDGRLTPMLETNRGCPFSCTFCHEGNDLITKVHYFSVSRVKAELDYVADHVRGPVRNLMFADPNFAMYERDREICEHIAEIQRRRQWPTSIFASTGKNRKDRIGTALRQLRGTMTLWMSVQSMDAAVLKEIKRDNISLATMLSLPAVLTEFDVPTYSELILGLPGETYESHVRSIAAVVDAGIDTVSLYTLMLLHGTELSLPATRARYGLRSHFRVLPRDFGRLSNGRIAVEIEEVVTSTNTLTFEDYQKARLVHLVVNVICNGKGFGPLFKFFKESGIPFFELVTGVAEAIDSAAAPVADIVASYRRLVREELWDSEEELRAFVTRPEIYERLLNGELGTNLIQTHLARSVAVMEDWAGLIFDVAMTVFERYQGSDEQREMLDEIKRFCCGRVHNLFGAGREADVPIYWFRHDLPAWYARDNHRPLCDFRLPAPAPWAFVFPPEVLAEVNDCIRRYGTTATGIGRILVTANTTRIWRQPVAGDAV